MNKTLEQIEQEEREDALKWRRDWLKYEELNQQAGRHTDDRSAILAFVGITMGIVGIMALAGVALFLYGLSGHA